MTVVGWRSGAVEARADRQGSRVAVVTRYLAAVFAAWVAVLIASGPVAGASPARWTGGIDVYRLGAYSMQQTWQWCTAADVEIARNIVLRRSDHSTSAQRTYFDWMRAHNRYAIPVSDGVDPQGWTAGLAHFVDSRYRLVASASFDAVLHSAAVSLRRTGLPVAIVVDNGNHGWLLTGFNASADPGVARSFTITSVRVVGPLYGRQSANGYDMPPDTQMSYSALRRFLTPFRDFHAMMIWDGLFVSMQADPTVPPGAAAPSGRGSSAAASSSAVAAASAKSAPRVAGTVGTPPVRRPAESHPSDERATSTLPPIPLPAVLLLAAASAVFALAAASRWGGRS